MLFFLVLFNILYLVNFIYVLVYSFFTLIFFQRNLQKFQKYYKFINGKTLLDKMLEDFSLSTDFRCLVRGVCKLYHQKLLLKFIIYIYIKPCAKFKQKMLQYFKNYCANLYFYAHVSFFLLILNFSKHSFNFFIFVYEMLNVSKYIKNNFLKFKLFYK